MNEQKPPYGIEWTRVPRPDGTRSKGFTWNVVTGCRHGCAWTMPDGHQAECYAKTVAETVARSAYPHGFEQPTFHPERLEEPLTVVEPAGIFLDSMADVMGPWVEAAHITQILAICGQAAWHTFFLLTKNAPRLAHWTFPPNVWVGASSPPDVMQGHRLTRPQQTTMLHKSLTTLAGVQAPIRWMSFEPLSWDVADVVQQSPGALQWAVIGAASRGRVVYPPDPEVLQRLLAVLDAQGVPIFYKGNLRALPEAAAAWREDFPGHAAGARQHWLF
jgi:protein gp37